MTQKRFRESYSSAAIALAITYSAFVTTSTSTTATAVQHGSYCPCLPVVAQVYLQLTLAALEDPSQRVAQGDGAGIGIELDRMHHYDGGGENPDGGESVSSIGSFSPESLLSRAEFYTDQALDSGSGLPLARLVKGQALALRGQHQVKM